MKTVGEFIAEWKIDGDDKEFVAALNAFQAEAFSDGLRSGADGLNSHRRQLDRERARLDWLDYNCSFVADSHFNLGPFKPGQLRELADAGIKASDRTLGL